VFLGIQASVAGSRGRATAFHSVRGEDEKLGKESDGDGKASLLTQMRRKEIDARLI